MFNELELPFIEDKDKEEMETVSFRFSDVRKKGLMSNIDKKRTILENLRRNATSGSVITSYSIHYTKLYDSSDPSPVSLTTIGAGPSSGCRMLHGICMRLCLATYRIPKISKRVNLGTYRLDHV